jgi:toxin ParE1/3/4
MGKIQKLADFPRSGRQRLELRPSLRSVPVGDYLILYYPLKDGVQVERVLHGSRDLEAQEYDDEDA